MCANKAKKSKQSGQSSNLGGGGGDKGGSELSMRTSNASMLREILVIANAKTYKTSKEATLLAAPELVGSERA